MITRQSSKEKKRDLIFDNKTLAMLIFPLLIEQLLAVFVGMADTIMIASVGEAAVSGVSLVDGVMNLFITLFAALATGGAVIAGQYLGYRDRKNADKAASQLIQFMLVSSLVITVLLYLGKSFILHQVFGAIDGDVEGHANTYLMIVSASIPFIAIYNGGAAIFRTMGNSKISMLVSIVMNAVNVAGNAFLIYGCHFGTAGVAIPTLVSRITAAVLILVLLMHSKGLIRLEKIRKLQFDWGMIHKILRIGIPNGLENSMFQLGKILVLSLVASFGTSAIAANAVSNTVAMFQILPGMSINLAVTTVIARCIGAGDHRQAEYYTKKLMILIYLAMLVVNGGIYFALPEILKIYNLTAQTADTAHQILLFHSVFAVTIWPVSFSLPCTLRAAGDVKVPMYISIASMWIFRIVFSYVLGQYLGMGVFGIWVAMIIDWCFRSICMIVRYKKGKWKLLKSI
ncbi:MAG: MATE family efflux transporter [Lachnospiraceae bacterium]|nr:MATE family efflux transporter [Lachnospiraceae bacterium]